MANIVDDLHRHTCTNKQVGHQRGSYFLHPKGTGWFARGELESRRDLGHKFDISLRHVTPYTPYGVLEELVPGASFVTIMRRPVERFLSLFNFRGELKKKFKVRQATAAKIIFWLAAPLFTKRAHQ